MWTSSRPLVFVAWKSPNRFFFIQAREDDSDTSEVDDVNTLNRDAINETENTTDDPLHRIYAYLNGNDVHSVRIDECYL